MVLLPQSYYEGALLQEDVSVPCSINKTRHEHCQYFLYPPLPAETEIVRGDSGYVTEEDERKRTNIYDDGVVLRVSFE